MLSIARVQDYLGMLDANTAIVRGPIDINASDCLIVIDMQNDFVSAASDNPVESPPFAVLSSPPAAFSSVVVGCWFICNG